MGMVSVSSSNPKKIKEKVLLVEKRINVQKELTWDPNDDWCHLGPFVLVQSGWVWLLGVVSLLEPN
jgi:hypothetical protein